MRHFAMRHFASIIAFFAFVGVLSFASNACIPLKSVAKGALDLGATLCIVANADRPDAEVKALCGVLDALDGPMHELLRTSREQASLHRSQGEFAGSRVCGFQAADGGK